MAVFLYLYTSPETTLIPRHFHVYLDESRQQGNQFMVLGGLILDRRYEPDFLEEFRRLQSTLNMTKELKWVKVSNQRVEHYLRFIDLLVKWSKRIQFQALVVENARWTDPRFSRDKSQAFDKMQYQLLVNGFGRRLTFGDSCSVIVDERQSSHSLDSALQIANEGLRAKYRFRYDPVREIRPVDSKQSPFVQLVDLLLGAIGYEVNGDFAVPGARQAKVDLMHHIQEQYGLHSFSWSTDRYRTDFSIWHFEFGNKKAT